MGVALIFPQQAGTQQSGAHISSGSRHTKTVPVNLEVVV